MIFFRKPVSIARDHALMRGFVARYHGCSCRDRVGWWSSSSSRVVLSSVYRDATERAFDRRLNLYLRTLIARSRHAGRAARPPVPVARRAAVRAAAVRLVTGRSCAPHTDKANAGVTLVCGTRSAEARGAWR